MYIYIDTHTHTLLLSVVNTFVENDDVIVTDDIIKKIPKYPIVMDYYHTKFHDSN